MDDVSRFGIILVMNTLTTSSEDLLLENASLRKSVGESQKTIDQQKETIGEQKEIIGTQEGIIGEQKETIEWFKRQIFGKKSEKIIEQVDSQQLYLEGFEVLPKKEEKTLSSQRTQERKGCLPGKMPSNYLQISLLKQQ